MVRMYWYAIACLGPQRRSAGAVGTASHRRRAHSAHQTLENLIRTYFINLFVIDNFMFNRFCSCFVYILHYIVCGHIIVAGLVMQN